MGIHPENKLIFTGGSEKVTSELVREWIYNGINPTFVSRFKENLFRSLSRHGNVGRDFDSSIDFFFKESLTQDLAERFTTAFRNQYLTICRELDHIIENVTHKIEQEKVFDEQADRYKKRK